MPSVLSPLLVNLPCSHNLLLLLFCGGVTFLVIAAVYQHNFVSIERTKNSEQNGTIRSHDSWGRFCARRTKDGVQRFSNPEFEEPITKWSAPFPRTNTNAVNLKNVSYSGRENNLFIIRQ